MLDIAFAKSALPKSGALALLIAEDADSPTRVLLAEADAATGGAISLRTTIPRSATSRKR